MKIRKSLQGFTLIELLVVISIIAILAGIAVPASMGVIDKGKQTKDLSNAKEVFKGLIQFAMDHDGAFPSMPQQDTTNANSTSNGTSTLQNANDAYANLVPKYVPTENIFWISGSKWCNSVAPDENTAVGSALSAGENGYAYITGLNTSSNPNFPVIADGFSQSPGVYTNDPNQPGGVWKGKVAIVVRVSGAGAAMPLSMDYRVLDNVGLPSKSDIFAKNAGSTNNPWLDIGGANLLLNPLKGVR